MSYLLTLYLVAFHSVGITEVNQAVPLPAAPLRHLSTDNLQHNDPKTNMAAPVRAEATSLCVWRETASQSKVSQHRCAVRVWLQDMFSSDVSG